MPELRLYRLFISHSWTYSDAYDKLVGLLNAAPNFRYANYSVPKNDPVHDAKNDAELLKAIQGQMAWSEVVLILAGVYASYSTWIKKEIQVARDTYRRPIIAIEPFASERTSVEVKCAADRIVAWSTTSIVTAIRELAK